ncbi:M42 family metallopeptidase [Oscillospiraceae bacterium LTW-04]|nr:M42 family peptidase [Oscillospiraceae bacterium MB24-C1]
MEKLILSLCELDGVAGHEQDVSHFIAQRIAHLAETVETDAMGNLIALVKGRQRRKRPVVVCAHTDEVGYLVKKITDTGLLKLVSVGAVDPRIAVGMRMRVGKNRIKGVVALKAYHLTTPAERRRAPLEHELSLDIGACSREQAETKVSVGDPVVFDYTPQLFGDRCIKAKALDDRAGCAILMKLMENKLEYDTWFAFTSGEEIWLRGALPLTRRLNPGACLVIEGTSAVDFTGIPKHMQGVRLRGGAAVSVLDRATIYNRAFREEILQKATQLGINWQYRTMDIGGTDAGVLHCEASGALALGVSFPTRNMHTAGLISYLPDILDVYRLSELFIQETGVCDV